MSTKGFYGIACNSPKPGSLRKAWESVEEAEEAFSRWNNGGKPGGSLPNTLRIQGPYKTRVAAKDADLSDGRAVRELGPSYGLQGL